MPAELLDDGSSSAPGHGRNGADAYRGAKQVDVPHDCYAPGDPCPECDGGKLYDKTPGVLIRIVGQAPLQATIYQLQKLRCHLCGKIFTASAPEEAGDAKYDATAASMIGLLKYGSGLPFNRLDRLQGTCQIPLPASTQWDVLAAVVPSLFPAYQELIRQAACGDVLYNDDTAIKYMLQRWSALTLFLRKAGAPLDNNICERALKKAILHRKNSLFYKTERGAGVGDLFMSLIYTCELCGANALDYLTQLQENADKVAAHPECWMPWNYRDMLNVLAAA